MPNKGVPPGIPLPPGPDLLYNTVEIPFYRTFWGKEDGSNYRKVSKNGDKISLFKVAP